MRSTSPSPTSNPVPTQGRERSDGTRPSVRLFALGMAVAFALLSIAACSSGPYGRQDPWKRRYFDSPDRVWQAIQISLEELGFTVESADRRDGTVRAVSPSLEPDPPVVLLIDQVMWVENDVSLFVKPADGDTRSERFQEAARELLAEIDGQLRGWGEKSE